MSLPYLQPYLGLSNGLNTLHAAGGGAGGIGGWVELARTTLGSAGDTIEVTSLADKRYYMVLTYFNGGGTAITPGIRVGNSSLDSGSNYSERKQINGAADVTATSQSEIEYGFGGANLPTFKVGYWANYASKQKLHMFWANYGSTPGATAAPARAEGVGKWANTSNVITNIADINTGAGDFQSGSEVVVLGYDPLDSHTNNFWEELASVQGTGSSNVLDSGVFTPKKYLWIQQFTSYGGSGNINPQLQVGYNTIDTGNNYSIRYNEDGGADGTITSYSHMGFHYVGSTSVYPSFSNTFIINNASNEKLAIMHTNDATGSGAGTAPARMESVSKWANTSNQINRVQFTNVGNVSTNSWLKVWGAD